MPPELRAASEDPCFDLTRFGSGGCQLRMHEDCLICLAENFKTYFRRSNRSGPNGKPVAE